MATNPYLVDDLAEQVMYAGQATEPEPSSFFMDAMDTMPGMYVAGATKSSRGASTLIRGGRADRAGTSAKYLSGSKSGVVRGGLSNLYYRPSNISRVATRSYLGADPVVGGVKYNPFYASSILNVAPRALANKSTQGWLNKLAGGKKYGESLISKGLVDSETGEMFSRGFTSRIGASARIGSMSQGKFTRNAGSIRSALGDAYSISGVNNPQSVGAMMKSASRLSSITGNASQLTSAQLTAMSGSGPLTSRMGAWVAASMGDITQDSFEAARRTAQAGGRGSVAAGVAEKTAARANAARGLVGLQAGEKARFTSSLMRAATKPGARAASLKLAGAAALRGGSRAIPGVGWALLAYDVGKFAGKTSARVASTALAAGASYTGATRVGIMQQSFTDTEVTRTSRARGVQAISNSRLNARSVLGNEASSMAAYF